MTRRRPGLLSAVAYGAACTIRNGTPCSRASVAAHATARAAVSVPSVPTTTSAAPVVWCSFTMAASLFATSMLRGHLTWKQGPSTPSVPGLSRGRASVEPLAGSP